MQTQARPSSPGAAASAVRWARRHPVLLGVLFAVTYAVAVAVGRASRPAGMPLALVWPAGAVAWLWLASAWHDRRQLVTPVAVLVALGVGINFWTGSPVVLGSVYGVAAALQPLISCAVLHRLQRRWGTTPWRLRCSADFTALLVAAFAGALVASTVGTTATYLATGEVSPLSFVSGILRAGTSGLVLVAVALRLLDVDAPRVVPGWRQARGLVPSFLVIVIAYAAVFGFTSNLPLAFLLMPLSLWVAVRYSTTVAAVHVLLIGVFVVATTLHGLGVFTMESIAVRVLLAQAFVAVTAMVTLVLALHRDERQLLIAEGQRLLAEAQDASRRADEQATLLRTVIDTTSDGLSVSDASGRVVLRNPAALRLMGETPAVEQGDWGAHYGVFTPEGEPVPLEQLPLSLALRGEPVDGVDLLVRTAYVPDGVVLRMSAHPMPGAPGAGWHGGAVMAFQDVTAERAAAQEISRARDLLAGVLDSATETAILSTDARGRIALFNVGAERMLGYRAADVLGQRPGFLHDPAELAVRHAELGLDEDHLSAAITHVPLRDGHETRRWTYLTRDGGRLPVQLTISAIRDADGELQGFMGLARDLSGELAHAAELADSEARFRLAFDNAPIGMMMVGLDPAAPGALLRVNSSLSRLLGYAEAELLTKNVLDFAHPDDLEVTREVLEHHANGGVEAPQVEKRYLHADSSTVWVRLSTTVVRRHDGEPYSLVLLEDVTARRAAEEALTHQALHDGLTGLPNRTLFTDRLQHALATAGRTVHRVGVMFVDLDGFKDVNDSAGHAAGDELLQQVTSRLGHCVRPGDTLARLGGDEFAVVCPDVDSAAGGATDDGGAGATANLRVIAERILTALRAPFDLAAGTFTVTASVGLSVAEPTSQDPVTAAERVVAAADEAMYGAKRAGKDRAHAAGGDEQVRSDRAARLLPELTTALARDEFVLHGQPVYDLATGRAVAVETLVRWQHPTRGLLAPAAFLDVAEAGPLMVGIGRRVLDESCRLASAWSQALGDAAPDVHVNVSGRQLEAGSLHDDVVAALARHGLPGHRLVLELTETHMPKIEHSLRKDLQRLRDRGVRIAIDDVGTGYSSLTRLTQLPVDILKIDLVFVAGLGTDPSCDAVVRAILSLGQGLGLSVVAEGVETQAQAELLRRYGCDTVQGYLYSRPHPEDVLLHRLRSAPEAPPAGSPAFRPLLTFRCDDLVPGCDRTFAGTAEEIRLAVADHVRQGHGHPGTPVEALHLRVG